MYTRTTEKDINRLKHISSVMKKCEQFQSVLPTKDFVNLLHAAVWHDCGYFLDGEGNHSIKGYKLLKQLQYSNVVCDLVRTHSFTDIILKLNGDDYRDVLFCRKQNDISFSKLYDILTYIDCTTDSKGNSVSLEERYTDIRNRYAEDSAEVKWIDEVKDDLIDIENRIKYKYNSIFYLLNENISHEGV